MDQIANMPVPQGDALAEMPVPGAPSPDYRNDVASPMQRGFRSGMNTLGAQLNALVGQTGETLGLSEFAADRFRDADEFAQAADTPGVKDWGQVKDFTSLTQFVGNLVGQGAATMVPAIGASIGLRRPVAGVITGFGVPSAGEQVRSLRADPVTAAKPPGQILTNAALTGAAQGTIYGTVGAPGQFTRRLAGQAAKESFGTGVTKAAAGQAVAMPAADIVGQKMHQQLNPDKPLDTSHLVEEAITGGVFGGVLGVAGHLPGRIARVPTALKTRFKREPAPLVEDTLPEHITTPEEGAAALKQHEESITNFMKGVWDNVKQTGAYKSVDEFMADPNAKTEAGKIVAEQWVEKNVKPKMEAVKQYTEDLAKRVKAGKATDTETKLSEMENKTSISENKPDLEVHDIVMAHLDSSIKPHLKPDQLFAVSAMIRKVAQNPDYPVPAQAEQLFGKKFQPMLEKVAKQMGVDVSMLKESFKQRNALEGEKLDAVKQVMLDYMPKKDLADPARRQAVLDTAPELLASLSDIRDPMKWHNDIFDTFGEHTAVVQQALEKIRDKKQLTSDAAFKGADRTVINEDEGVVKEGKPVDKRLDQTFNDTPESVKKLRALREELETEFSQKNVSVVEYSPEEGKLALRIENAEQVGLTKEAIGRVREDPKYNRSKLSEGIISVKTSDAPGGLKVNLMKLTSEMMRREPPSERNVTQLDYVRDMFSRGMAALMNTGTEITKLREELKTASSERAAEIEKLLAEAKKSGQLEIRGFTDKGREQLIRKTAAGTWDIPDNTPVARMHGKTYTYGEIKKYKLSQDELLGIDEAMIKAEIDLLKKMPAAEQLSEGATRLKAIENAIEKAQQKAEAQTYLDPWEIPKEEQDPLSSKPTDRSRDPKSERTYQEETQQPLDKAPPAAPRGPTPGQEAAPVTIRRETETVAEARTRLEGVRDELRKEYSDLKNFKGGKDKTAKLAEIEKRGRSVTEAMKNLEEPEDTTPVRLQGTSPYLAKDQAKSDRATKFIGRGSSRSSTAAYAKAWADKANSGNYVADDKVFISAEGNRGGRIAPDFAEIKKATDVGATIITDNAYGRNRAYNVGEREVAEFLSRNGYREITPGEWKLENTKFSEMDLGKGEVPEAERAKVREYVKKVLGDSVNTDELFKKMEQAGSFANLKGEEVLHISINAMDAAGTGYHEAAHAFLARLMKADPKARFTLERAAGSAPIVARLNELLKDHPKAREQLKDAEERVAYMYQFWASGKKGLLNVGPETKGWFDKVKGFFRKVAALWADDLTTAVAVDKAGDLLTAFHRGDFANRNTVAQVLRDKFPRDAIEQTEKMLPWLSRLSNKFIWTSTGAVRDMNVPALTQVMDQFFKHTGEVGELGFTQTKHIEYNQRINKISDIFKSMPTEERQKLVWDDLHTGKDPVTAEGKALKAWLKEARDYLVSKGVKLVTTDKEGKVKFVELGNLLNYFPRVYNQEHLRTVEGKKAFLELLKKYGVSDAEGAYINATRDAEMGKPSEDASIGLTYFTPQTAERPLGKIPDAELAPFLSTDLFGTLSQYLRRAVRRAEYTERFGNTGERIAEARGEAEKQGATPTQLKVFDESVQGMEGSLGSDIDPKLKTLYSGLMTYQNVRLLPLQLFSSLIDPLGITVRGGTFREAGTAFLKAARDLAKFKGDDAWTLAKTIGAIDAANDRGLMSDMNGSEYMPKFPRWLNDKFFRYNGMEKWNTRMRAQAAAAAENFIERHMTRPNEHSTRYLEELGLTKDSARSLDNPNYVRALNQWVDEAILRPNAALRPTYMNDPNWMLISHLKQYTYLIQKVIVARVYNEATHGNYTPAMALAGYVPGMLAADMLRANITPGGGDNNARAGWDAMDYFGHAMQRAGLFGPSQFGLEAGTDVRRGGFGIESAAGPTIQQLINFAQAPFRGDTVLQLEKALPGYVLIKPSGH